MNAVISQCVGIDMSSKTFEVCLKHQDQQGKITIKGTRSFDNSSSGFAAYLKWCNSRRHKGGSLVHLLEATGVYHEDLCYYLYEQGEQVSVQLPQKVKYFIKSLNLKTKTDRADAKAIAQMGLSHPIALWQPPSKDFKAIRDLCRTLSKLKQGYCATASQLHALRRAHDSTRESIAMLEALQTTYQKLIEQCQAKLLKRVEQDTQLKEKIARITVMKGIRTLTVIRLLAETDGFRRCESIRQLVSYAGLDVVQHQSGQYAGKSKISKKGNAYIREALYMPALCAARHDPNMTAFYERLKTKMPAKKQATVAVMRKLLIVVYTLWKNQQQYNPEFIWQPEKKSGENPRCRIVLSAETTS